MSENDANNTPGAGVDDPHNPNDRPTDDGEGGNDYEPKRPAHDKQLMERVLKTLLQHVKNGGASITRDELVARMLNEPLQEGDSLQNICDRYQSRFLQAHPEVDWSRLKWEYNSDKSSVPAEISPYELSWRLMNVLQELEMKSVIIRDELPPDKNGEYQDNFLLRFAIEEQGAARPNAGGSD